MHKIGKQKNSVTTKKRKPVMGTRFSNCYCKCRRRRMIIAILGYTKTNTNTNKNVNTKSVKLTNCNIIEGTRKLTAIIKFGWCWLLLDMYQLNKFSLSVFYELEDDYFSLRNGLAFCFPEKFFSIVTIEFLNWRHWKSNLLEKINLETKGFLCLNMNGKSRSIHRCDLNTGHVQYLKNVND